MNYSGLTVEIERILTHHHLLGWSERCSFRIDSSNGIDCVVESDREEEEVSMEISLPDNQL